MLAGGRPHPNPPPEGEGIYIGWELGVVGIGDWGILRQAQDECSVGSG